MKKGKRNRLMIVIFSFIISTHSAVTNPFHNFENTQQDKMIFAQHSALRLDLMIFQISSIKLLSISYGMNFEIYA